MKEFMELLEETFEKVMENDGSPENVFDLCDTPEKRKLAANFVEKRRRELATELVNKKIEDLAIGDAKFFAFPALPYGGFIVYDNRLYIRLDFDIMVDYCTKQPNGFAAVLFSGDHWCSLAYVLGHDWLSMPQVEKLMQFGVDKKIECKDFVGGTSAVNWYTMPGKSPAYIRTIGVDDSGEAFVAVDSVPLPEHGMEGVSLLKDGHKFIRLRDWKEAMPKEFGRTYLLEALDDLRTKEGVKINEL